MSSVFCAERFLNFLSCICGFSSSSFSLVQYRFEAILFSDLLHRARSISPPPSKHHTVVRESRRSCFGKHSRLQTPYLDISNASLSRREFAESARRIRSVSPKKSDSNTICHVSPLRNRLVEQVVFTLDCFTFRYKKFRLFQPNRAFSPLEEYTESARKSTFCVSCCLF